MKTLVKGQWPAQNTTGILRSVAAVFKTGNIDRLTKDAYQHITLHMGFIAHYNKAGFCDVYKDLYKFAQALMTSEYSTDRQYNLRDAGRYRGKFFVESYGKEYCDSVVFANYGILAIATKYLEAQDSK